MPNYYTEAFRLVLPDAKAPEPWYVCLMCNRPFYGGPEEGGWWGQDTIVAGFRQCQDRAEAERLRMQVETLAQEMSRDAKKAFGEYCLRSMEALEARGLEADYLPEPDGEESYCVIVTQGLPEPQYGNRRYE